MIPHCGFELELLSEQIQRLRHKVYLKGVSSPNSFYIRYPQPEGKVSHHNYFIIICKNGKWSTFVFEVLSRVHTVYGIISRDLNFANGTRIHEIRKI